MDEITNTDRLARAGYLARAVVYGLLGYLAFSSASKADEGPAGTFDVLRDIPAGSLVLTIVAVGLLAYGIYKLSTAAFDLDGDGNGAKGIAKRVGMAAGGSAYLALSYAAVRVVAGERSTSSSGAETAGSVMALPLGELVLAVVGFGFIAAALFQLRSAWTRHFMRRLSPAAPPFTCTIGRVGLAARSVVFAIMGWSLLRSAWSEDQSEVRDLGGVLHDLRDTGTLYLLVAAGLILFAIYSAIEARYRIVPRVDVADHAKRKLAGAAAR